MEKIFRENLKKRVIEIISELCLRYLTGEGLPSTNSTSSLFSKDALRRLGVRREKTGVSRSIGEFSFSLSERWFHQLRIILCDGNFISLNEKC